MRISKLFIFIVAVIVQQTISHDDVSCAVVKQSYQNAGCCRDSTSPFAGCEELNFHDSLDIPANYNFAGMDTSFKIVPHIKNNPTLQAKWDKTFGFLLSEQFQGPNGICWETQFGDNINVTKLQELFPALNIPSYNYTGKYYDYLTNSSELDSIMDAPLNQADINAVTSSTFTDEFGDADELWGTVFSNCIKPRTMAWFFAAMEVMVNKDKVIVGGPSPLVSRFDAASMKYDAVPEASTWYSRIDETKASDNVRRVEYLHNHNGGVRAVMASNDNYVCFQGYLTTLSGWGQIFSNEEAQKRNMYYQDQLAEGITCYDKDFQDGDEPVKTFKFDKLAWHQSIQNAYSQIHLNNASWTAIDVEGTRDPNKQNISEALHDFMSTCHARDMDLDDQNNAFLTFMCQDSAMVESKKHKTVKVIFDVNNDVTSLNSDDICHDFMQKYSDLKSCKAIISPTQIELHLVVYEIDEKSSSNLITELKEKFASANLQDACGGEGVADGAGACAHIYMGAGFTCNQGVAQFGLQGWCGFGQTVYTLPGSSAPDATNAEGCAKTCAPPPADECGAATGGCNHQFLGAATTCEAGIAQFGKENFCGFGQAVFDSNGDGTFDMTNGEACEVSCALVDRCGSLSDDCNHQFLGADKTCADGIAAYGAPTFCGYTPNTWDIDGDGVFDLNSVGACEKSCAPPSSAPPGGGQGGNLKVLQLPTLLTANATSMSTPEELKFVGGWLIMLGRTKVDDVSPQMTWSGFHVEGILKHVPQMDGQFGRSFHIAVDDKYVHNVQRTNSAMFNSDGQTMFLFKYNKFFAPGETTIGFRIVSPDQVGKERISAAKFYGSHPISTHGDNVFWNNGIMVWSPNDYGFVNVTQKVNKIPIPVQPSFAWWLMNDQFFDNGPRSTAEPYQIESAVYGNYATKNHVVMMYSVARTWDRQLADSNSKNPVDKLIEAHTNEQEYVLFKINAATKQVEDAIEVVTESSSNCEGFAADDDAEYGYMACGQNLKKQAGMEGNHIQLIRKVALSSGTKSSKVSTDFGDSGLSTVITMEGNMTRSTKVDFDGIESMNSVGVQNIRVLNSDLGMLHLDNSKQNVYVGTNIANMGRTFHNIDNSATQANNVIIGSKSGNVEDGLENSIIIGNNIMNVNPATFDDLPQTTFAGQKAYTDSQRLNIDPSLYTQPVKGELRIGMDNKILVSGNFEKDVLKLPSTNSLKILKTAKMQDPNFDLEKGVFVKNNILQLVDKGKDIDGVQDILDQLKELKKRICIMENNGDDTLCKERPSQSFTLTLVPGNGNGGEIASLEKLVGPNKWEKIVSWDGRDVTVIAPFDMSIDISDVEYPDAGGPRKFETTIVKGRVESGTYRLVAADESELAPIGWNVNSGIAPPMDGLSLRCGIFFQSGETDVAVYADANYFYMDPNEPMAATYAALYTGNYNLTAQDLVYQDLVFNVTAKYCADEISLSLEDTFGDGWNGDTYIYINNDMSTQYTVSSGKTFSANICVQNLMPDGCVHINYDASGGQWLSENRFSGTSYAFYNFGPHIGTPSDETALVTYKLCASGVTKELTPF